MTFNTKDCDFFPWFKSGNLFNYSYFSVAYNFIRWVPDIWWCKNWRCALRRRSDVDLKSQWRQKNPKRHISAFSFPFNFRSWTIIWLSFKSWTAFRFSRTTLAESSNVSPSTFSTFEEVVLRRGIILTLFGESSHPNRASRISILH